MLCRSTRSCGLGFPDALSFSNLSVLLAHPELPTSRNTRARTERICQLDVYSQHSIHRLEGVSSCQERDSYKYSPEVWQSCCWACGPVWQHATLSSVSSKHQILRLTFCKENLAPYHDEDLWGKRACESEEGQAGEIERWHYSCAQVGGPSYLQYTAGIYLEFKMNLNAVQWWHRPKLDNWDEERCGGRSLTHFQATG